MAAFLLADTGALHRKISRGAEYFRARVITITRSHLTRRDFLAAARVGILVPGAGASPCNQRVRRANAYTQLSTVRPLRLRAALMSRIAVTGAVIVRNAAISNS